MQIAHTVKTHLIPTKPLTERAFTDMIVIHHTGSEINGTPFDDDHSADDIDRWHKNAGWSMIGYHFVIRKNGAIERGRPLWAIGSHAYGENSHTIGIHLCGNFDAVQPSKQQIEMAAMLIANLCNDYNIPIDRDHVVGHGELMNTGCPGRLLQDKLDIIVGKAIWYLNQSDLPTPDAVVKSVIEIRSGKPIDFVTLSKIKAIFAESNCPNESLFNSIDDFTSYDGYHVVQLSNGNDFVETIIT